MNARPTHEQDNQARGAYFNRPGIAVVRWDPGSAAVYVEWQGWADSTEFAALHEAGLRALREHNGSRWLSDSRNMRVVKESDQAWLDRDWFPRALAAGLRRIGMVTANKALPRMNVEQILNRIPSTELDVMNFATVEAAAAWLTRSPSLQ